MAKIRFLDLTIFTVIALLKKTHFLLQSDTKDDQPPPRKPARPSTVPKSTTKTRRLAKEKGFVLDGIAVGSIQVNRQLD